MKAADLWGVSVLSAVVGGIIGMLIVFEISVAPAPNYPCTVGEPVLVDYETREGVYIDGRRAIVYDKVPVYECKRTEE